MNDRAKAIAILRQARDALAERLTERVLHSKGEILEDALGLSHVGDIEAIYEELGGKLQHVNSLLRSLPPEEEAASAAESNAAESNTDSRTSEETATASMNTTVDASMRHAVAIPALPPPVARRLAITSQPISFRTFATLIRSGDLHAAAVSLAELLGLDLSRAQRCCNDLIARMADDDNFLANARSLHQHLATGNADAALALMYEVFGLAREESIGALSHLQERYRS